MTLRLATTSLVRGLFIVSACVLSAHVAHAQILFSENFNGLTLGNSVNERVGQQRVTVRAADFGTSMAIPNAFSHTGPAGWTIDNNFNVFGLGTVDDAATPPGVPRLGDPNYGVEEWEGWSFANKTFWFQSDDQGRSSFTKGMGTVAVADSDEWDDLIKDATGSDIPRQGFMDTGMTTGNINVSAYQGQVLDFKFDSSWDDEAFDDAHVDPAFTNKNNQSAVVVASFDGGAPIVLDTWDSDSAGGFYKGTAYDETITRSVAVPAGATNVKFTFGYFNAANDWWWAVDNLSLTAGATTVWSENFETVPLGPSVNERIQGGGKVTAANNDAASVPRANSFTKTPPPGWTIDNSGIDPIAIGDNNRGVFEWEGWSFADREFWSFSAQGDATSFTKASGPFAIADSDEFADLGGTNAADPPGTGDVTQPMSTALRSPAINIAGVGAGSLALAFDSSWRPEGTAQAAEITVDYGSGPIVVLRWDSDPASPNRHGDDASGAFNLNESVLVPLNNPAGASTARIEFKYLNGSNNWFWAVDNIVVRVIPEPGSALLMILAICGVNIWSRRRRT
jgi:hypothetical protein